MTQTGCWNYRVQAQGELPEDSAERSSGLWPRRNFWGSCCSRNRGAASDDGVSLMGWGEPGPDDVGARFTEIAGLHGHKTLALPACSGTPTQEPAAIALVDTDFAS